MTTVAVHRGQPAVNVKVRDFGGPDLLAAIRERFGCDQATAEQASEMAWESAVANFWRGWQEPMDMGAAQIDHYFTAEVSIDCAGRSGGWLEVSGLPEDLEYDWSPELVAQWAEFERDVLADVAHYTAAETILDDIEANRWAETGAEQYNYFDRNGATICIVDDKRVRDAAPELLAACRLIGERPMYTGSGPFLVTSDDLETIRAAIEQATGVTA